MSDSARLELESYRELEVLMRRLGEELVVMRRRALTAESRLRDADMPEGPLPSDLRERIAELEQENASLRGQLDAATARTQGMLDRVHFLRQQVQRDGR